MKKNLLALMMAVCMLLSSFPAEVFAEDDVLFAEPFEAEVEEAVGEIGAEGLMVEDEYDLPGDDGEEPVAEDAPVDAGEAVPEGTIAADAAFITGYARVIARENWLYDSKGDAIAENVPLDAVVYVFDRNLDDQVAVSFLGRAGLIEGWMDACDLRPLTDKEVEDFRKAADADVPTFDAEGTIPLPVVDFALPGTEVVPEAAEPESVEAEAEAEVPQTAEDAEQNTEEVQQNVEEAPEAAEEVQQEAEAEAPETVEEAQQDAEAETAEADEDAQTATDEEAPEEPMETVDAPAEGTLALNNDSLTLGVGEASKALEVIVGDVAYEGEVTFTSSDSKVATVSAAGVVTGKKAGSAVITAECEGMTAECAVTVKRAPYRVVLSPTTMKLSVGMEQALNAAPDNGAACSTFTYSSSSKKIATVENGVVRGESAGSTFITVKSYNGRVAYCRVTVTAAPAKVALAAAQADLAVDQKLNLVPKALDSAGKATTANFTYAIDPASPNPDCIALDEATGEVMALAKGRATVIVTAHNGVSAACEIAVKPAAADIYFEKADPITIGYGEKYKGLKLVLVPPEGEDDCTAKITWRSSKANVAAVDQNGMVTGKYLGKATIYATTHNGIEVSVPVEVKWGPSTVTVKPTKATLSVDMTLDLDVTLNKNAASGTFTYTSSKPEIASVENGVITAHRKGEATITVKAFNGRSGSCKVTVVSQPDHVELDCGVCTIPEAQTKKLKPKAIDENGDETFANYTFTVNPASPDPDCVEINETTGEMKGLRKGSAVIDVVTHNGKTASCAVNVVCAPADIEFTEDGPIVIGMGEKYAALGVRMIPPEGEDSCDAALTWSSGTKYVAKVDADGVITGSYIGKSKITVKTHNGLSKSIQVEVKRAPYRVTVKPASMTLSVDMSAQLKPSADAGAASSAWKYFCDKPEIATVDENGVVTGIAKGTATVTVKAFNGRSTSCKVTVVNVPDTIVMDAETMKVPVDQMKKIGATALDVEGDAVPTTFTYTIDPDSPNPDALDIDAATGEIVGRSKGTAIVRATSHNGKSATCKVYVVPAPAAIAIGGPSEVVLGIGETDKTLADRLVLTPPEGEDSCEAVITWSSSKATIAKVDAATGEVKANYPGTAVITATTHNGLKATVKYTVKYAPYSVTASPAKLTMGVGETAQVGYKLPSGTAGSATWQSDSDDVASVTQDGLVTANGVGTAKLTVTTFNKKKATVTVTVKAAPDSISISKEALVIGVGQKATLTASIPEGTGGAISWVSGDDAVASVSGGSVKGLAVGQTIVAARTYNGHEAPCAVTVKPAPTAIKLPYADNTVTIGIGDSLQLEPDVGDAASSFTYSNSSTYVMSVSAAGVVKGLHAGTATVTIKTYNGLTAKLKVIVKKAPGSITVTPKSYEIGVGEHAAVTYKLPAGTAGSVTVESTDTRVVSVDEKGNVVGLAVGEAQVVARTFNGHTDTCTVKVFNAPETVETDVSFVELGVGQSFQVVASLDSNARSRITYESDDTSIATVTADGMIQAVGKGETVVRVRTYLPDVYASVAVTVWNAPASLTLEPAEMSMLVEESVQLTPVIPEDSRTEFTYTSSDPKVAAVDESGVVSARTRGKTTITVKTHNGLSASVKLTVYDPWYPEEMILLDEPEMMFIGDTYQVLYEILPETAKPSLVWTTSNERVATVTQEGLIEAVGMGYATIVAESEKNPDVRAEIKVVVQSEDLTLVIPARTTNIAGISENLAKIYAVRDDALGEIERIYDSGLITRADADKRRSMVTNIFNSYAFPWMTLKKQVYWNVNNSEGGLKDFKPDRVYYGLPYISGAGLNRVYNRDKALSENRYYSSGNGYYILNQNKYLNGKYVGNDCSGLCNTSIWGTSSSHTQDRTAEIAVSSAYVTKSFASLRPGDLLCKGYAHVVMFLYWADVDHTKIMMIENGGAEKGTNTVHCDVHELSYYKNKGYSVRRLASLG